MSELEIMHIRAVIDGKVHNVDYVKRTDYDALEAEMDKVRAQLNKLCHETFRPAYVTKVDHEVARTRIRELEAALDECCHDWRDTKVWLTNSAIGRAARGFTSETEGVK